MEDNTTSQPVEQIDVLEEAKTRTAYKIGIGMNLYLLPVVLAIGVFANIISFCVMLMKHNRSISCCIYIAYLAMSDLGMILVSSYFYFKWSIKVLAATSSIWECKLPVWSAGFFTLNSCYFVVMMTVDRYLAICHPHRFQTFRTAQTALKVGAGVVAGVGVYTMPFLYTANYVNGFCSGVATVSTLSSIYSMMQVALGSVVPFSILIVMNGSIALTAWKRNKKTAVQKNTGPAKNNQNPGTKKGEKQLIVMLFLVCGAFLVLTLPLYIRFLLAVTWDYKSSATATAKFTLFYHIASNMSTANHAINFFLYILGGKGFRKDVLKLFGISRETSAGRSTTGGTGTTNA